MVPELAFEILSTGAQLRLSVAGEIDLATAPSLEYKVHSVLGDRPTDLLLDISGVTFCDSTGVGALFRVRDAVTAAGCGFQLRGATGVVHRVLATVGALDALNAKP